MKKPFVYESRSLQATLPIRREYKTLYINSEYVNEAIEFIEQEKIDCITICSHHYKKKNIDFIKEIKGLKGVIIGDMKDVDLSPMEQCLDLEDICVSDANTRHLNFSLFPKLKYLRLDWLPGTILPTEQSGRNLIELVIYPLKNKSLEVLPYYENLLRMEIVQGSITSLSGIEKYQNLIGYDHFYGRTLVDISAVTKLPKLEMLRFENCRRIQMEQVFEQCKSLKCLRLFCTPDIPSLSFLKKMKSIEYLGISDCCVLDGDMTPLLALKDFIFGPSKKYYTHTEKELLAIHKEMKETKAK